MSIFNSLYSAAADGCSLDLFLRDNISKLADFCSENIETQKVELDDFERFVLFKSRVIEELDYTKSYNRAFVYYLMDYCERFCSRSAIVQLYRIIQDKRLAIGSRLEAAMMYLYNVSSNQDYVDRFEEICCKLQTAIYEEEDDDAKAKATFLNYYSYVVYNTSHPKFAQDLQSKYFNQIESDAYPFLRGQVIKDCLSLDLSDSDFLFQTIQNKIDDLLGRRPSIVEQTIYSDYIIEDNTIYAGILALTPKRFLSIRNISVQQLSLYDNPNDIFSSLGRGVRILEDESQLYSYLNSYGNMHEAKMLSALQSLPIEELNGQNIEIFDWACGQGLASVVFYEYINNKRTNLNVNRVVLIEPSEIALKRAALHVRHFDKSCEIKTILKDVDSVQNDDVKSNRDTIKVHLFSNILDVEGFSMNHLISLVQQTQRGKNFFVCVSPYITDAKTARIDEFVSRFAYSYDMYRCFAEIENQKGTWKNNWTRVIRTFEVNI